MISSTEEKEMRLMMMMLVLMQKMGTKRDAGDVDDFSRQK